uniref:Ovule protein n=1 Tax=Caenorhabditis tropicalis TaxID=1561998 RepID=A0A1I7TCX2_9PELO
MFVRVHDRKHRVSMSLFMNCQELMNNTVNTVLVSPFVPLNLYENKGRIYEYGFLYSILPLKTVSCHSQASMAP